jgi:Tol biopolymer transport system component
MQKLFLLTVFGFFVCLLSCSPIQKAVETSPSRYDTPVTLLVTPAGTASITYDSGPATVKLMKVSGLFPNWSSDSKRIFYVSGRDVLVMDLSNNSLRKLLDGKSASANPYLDGFSVSPDDQKIAIVDVMEQGAKDVRDIYVLHPDSWSIHRLTENAGNNTFPSWSADGKTIAFTSDRDGYARIYNMSETGENLVMLTRDPSDNMKPAFSKDGERLAFVSFRDGNAEIYVMSSDGSDQRNLTNNPAMDIDPNWSPDSGKIVFSSDRGGNFDLYVMDADGSNVERLTQTEEGEMQPAWSPSGNEIAFSTPSLPSAYLANENLKALDKGKTDKTEGVQFPDPEFEAAIRQHIGKPEGQITETDLQNVFILTAEDKGIRDITGIEKCVSLGILNLPGNDIEDISPLSKLTKLKLLTLPNNKIRDISSLSSLTNVEVLILISNQIVDIQPLSNLTKLETLLLIDNQITDMSALSHLTRLRKVRLDCNKIVDVKPLSDLPYLTVLGLQSNQVSDIGPLASNPGIGKWDEVKLRRNPLNDEAYDTHIPALQERGVKVSFSPKD